MPATTWSLQTAELVQLLAYLTGEFNWKIILEDNVEEPNKKVGMRANVFRTYEELVLE